MFPSKLANLKQSKISRPDYAYHDAVAAFHVPGRCFCFGLALESEESRRRSEESRWRSEESRRMQRWSDESRRRQRRSEESRRMQGRLIQRRPKESQWMQRRLLQRRSEARRLWCPARRMRWAKLAPVDSTQKGNRQEL